MERSLTDIPSKRKSMIANKAVLRRILEEQDKQADCIFDSTASPQKSRELMLLQGVRPEGNSFFAKYVRCDKGRRLFHDTA